MKKTKDKDMKPDMTSPDGKEDAFIHDPILDNPAADKAFQDAAIIRAMARGMSLDLAHRLYGNKA